MSGLGSTDVRVFADLNALATAAAEAVVGTLTGAVRAAGRCSLALSGGGTPLPLHRLLASQWKDEIPWKGVHVFWGDERYVPHDDPRSNYRMARETLLDHVPCPASNIHPMPTQPGDPDAAARAYDATLRSYFGDGPPRFDLVLLGIGEEGHTASIFPGSIALTEGTRWTLAVTTPADPPVRLTLTLPVLTAAAAIDLLVAGAEKHDALAHILAENADPQRFPAAGVRLAAGRVTWWLDRPSFTGAR